MNRLLSGLLYIFSSLAGLLAFSYPFWGQITQVVSESAAPRSDAPLLSALLVGVCLTALLLDLQGGVTNTRVVALLGVLAAMVAVLRFLETAIPAPGGFSPIFAPVILAGYVFGARFGFLLGVMGLLTSALLTGGLGPWLPYQMLVTGWVGLTSGWLPGAGRPPQPHAMPLLTAWGAGWGLLYGFLLNLYFWPFIVGQPDLSWQPGSSLGELATHYLAFYVASSLVWDIFRSLGNVALMLALGRPALAAFSRYQRRFQFTRLDVAATSLPHSPAGAPALTSQEVA